MISYEKRLYFGVATSSIYHILTPSKWDLLVLSSIYFPGYKTAETGYPMEGTDIEELSG